MNAAEFLEERNVSRESQVKTKNPLDGTEEYSKIHRLMEYYHSYQTEYGDFIGRDLAEQYAKDCIERTKKGIEIISFEVFLG